MKNVGRTIVVSNRLPVSVGLADGTLTVRPSSGGLITAMLPIARRSGGVWIGWPGTNSPNTAAVESLIAHTATSMGLSSLVPVFLTEHEHRLFYQGCCNEIIWPLFHDLICKCTFAPEPWEIYREVNEKFADTVEPEAHPNDFVWVHDYHLMLLGEALRDRELPVKTAYFHHIPFPSPDVFAKLPWRAELLRALLHFNELGFQTSRDRDNFAACVQRFLPGCTTFEPSGSLVISSKGHTTHARACPISIDFEEFNVEASSGPIVTAAKTLRSQVRSRHLVLGIDRLDYTKGLTERLLAYRSLLQSHPELRGEITLLQVVVPSREDIPGYEDLKRSFQVLVSEINSQFGTECWSPIRYLHKYLSRAELVALYRAADVMLITSLKDGMNLVAKEFCAARGDGAGVLVLSEFAGAASELFVGALLVNPFDQEQTAKAIISGLRMNLSEQRERMQRLREQVRMHDVFYWAASMSMLRGRHATECLAPMPQRPVSLTAIGA